MSRCRIGREQFWQTLDGMAVSLSICGFAFLMAFVADRLVSKLVDLGAVDSGRIPVLLEGAGTLGLSAAIYAFVKVWLLVWHHFAFSSLNPHFGQSVAEVFSHSSHIPQYLRGMI